MNTEKTIWKLKQVVVRSNDNDYGEWRIIDDEIILTNNKQDGTYLSQGGNIFCGYEATLDKEKQLIEEFTKKGWQYKKDCPTIEINWLATIEDEVELETIKKVFNINSENKKRNTIYEKVQHYGGAEEGGWWYHNYYLSDYDYDSMSDKEREELLVENRYGEGYVMYDEFYRGENEKTATEYYC